MAAAPAAFGAPAGTRDREGAAWRNWHGWKALSRGFIHIVFFLRERDISRSRGPGGYSIALFAMRHTSTPLTQKPHHTLTPHHTLKNHTTLLDSWIHSFTDFTDDTQRSVGLGMYAGIIHGRHLSISFLGWRAGLSGGSRQ